MSDKKFDFEKSFKELEGITQSFEGGELNIEKGMKDFERGLKLAQELKARLSEVENNIEVIKAKFEGEHSDVEAS